MTYESYMAGYAVHMNNMYKTNAPQKEYEDEDILSGQVAKDEGKTRVEMA